MIGVLANPQSWYLKDLQRAAKAQDQAIAPLSFRQLTAKLAPSPKLTSRTLDDSVAVELDRLSAVLVRTMPLGSLEQVVFRMNVLHRLAAAGTPVVNSPRCLEIAIDKYLALAELQAAGLPVPTTCTTEDWETAMEQFEQLGGDVVVKPLFGAEGRGITRITDEAVAWRTFRTLAQLGLVIYQQEFIPHHGHDVRVLYLDGQCFGMKRVNASDWRTNVSRGATTEPLVVTDELGEMSRHAAEAVGAKLAGVDFLTGVDGKCYAIEVNAVPGWRALQRTLKIDIASHVLKLLR